MKARRRDDFLRFAAGLIFLARPQVSPHLLPLSTLPLDLAGVVVNAASPSRSVCLIRGTYPVKPGIIFRPGQNVFEFAEIKAIGRDGVVLRNLVTNRPEFLTFAWAKPRPKPQPAPSPPIVTAAPDGVKLEIPKGTVDHYLKNLPDLLDSAYAALRYRQGDNGRRAIEGYEISRIKEGGIVEQLGLKNGDIVLDVNGEPLDGLASVMRLIGRIQDIAQAKMTVLRNGQKMSFLIQKK